MFRRLVLVLAREIELQTLERHLVKRGKRRSVNYVEHQWHIHTWRNIGNLKNVEPIDMHTDKI
jgi:hypothetical protein